MGGYGSGRRFGSAGKPDTDPLLSIDIRHLVRNGLLKAAPGETRDRRMEWASRDGPAGSILVRLIGNGDDWPPEVTLLYATRGSEAEAGRERRERIGIETTPCRFGGARPWLVCPGCGKRKGVLRCLGGAFRCTACHQIAYTSTRESVSDRAIRRVDKLRDRISGDGGSERDVPSKPTGMHWSTYRRFVERIDDATCVALGERGLRSDRVERWLETVEKRS